MSERHSVNGRGRSSSPAAPALEQVEDVVAAIALMNLEELRAEWARRLASPPPRCRSKEVMRGLLAWHIQAGAYGGLSADTARRLRRIAGRFDNGEGKRRNGSLGIALKPGTVLTREWRDALHKVHVLDAGFAHAGRTYRSLSEVARIITGTRWSGPRFFGVAVEAPATPSAARPRS